MDEKPKLYMRQNTNGYYAVNDGGVYFANGHILTNSARYYKTLKGLAIAIRKAGYHGIDKTSEWLGGKDNR